MSSSPFNPLGPAHYSPANPEIASTDHPAKRVGVFFATREGHTRVVAERIAADLRKHGFDVDLHDVRHRFAFALSHYSAAVLAASVHQGNHEREMIRFVKDHRAELERIPTAFVSVTLSETGVEKRDATPSEHDQFVSDVRKMLDKFFADTEWYPTYVKPVAGALLYSKYNFFLRWIMKRVARKAGSDTDTSRDYDYTDWIGLDRFFDDFAAEIRSSQAPESTPDADSKTTMAEKSVSHV
jgi:menaquinone-dependent protoporphyrinogen oxidase